MHETAAGRATFTPRQLSLIKAMLKRDSFTHEDLVYLTGLTKQNIRKIKREILTLVPGLLEECGRELTRPTGRPVSIWRIRPERRAPVEKVVLGSLGKPTQASRLIDDLPLLNEARGAITAAIASSEIADTRDLIDHALAVIQQSAGIVARLEEGGQGTASVGVRANIAAALQTADQARKEIQSRLEAIALRAAETIATVDQNEVEMSRNTRQILLDPPGSGRRRAEEYAEIIARDGVSANREKNSRLIQEGWADHTFVQNVADALEEVARNSVHIDGFKFVASKFLEGVRRLLPPAGNRFAQKLREISEIRGLDEEMARETREMSAQWTKQGSAFHTMLVELNDSDIGRLREMAV